MRRKKITFIFFFCIFINPLISAQNTIYINICDFKLLKFSTTININTKTITKYVFIYFYLP